MNTYGDPYCAWCNAQNLVNFGDQSDQTGIDYDGFTCYKCKKENVFRENDGEPEKITVTDPSFENFMYADGCEMPDVKT